MQLRTHHEEEAWPALPLQSWRDTCETLHRYAQIVGKLQLATTPLESHFWNVAFHVTARGLATRALRDADRCFDLELDFVDHALTIRASDGGRRVVPIVPRTVAAFYAEVNAALAGLGIHVAIWDHPVELASEAIPFREDHVHSAYDPEWATRFWRVLVQAEGVLEEFRSRFLGKASPVGFYWGTFDLCAARYSGARVPTPPTGTIEREAFSHEVSEVGFWPGDARWPHPAFFALHAPAPEGFATAPVLPREAFWSEALRCFLLPYDVVRAATSPRETLLEFFETTYAAGAALAGWNRAELERPSPRSPHTAKGR